MLLKTCSKKSQKLPFVTKVAQNLLQKAKTFFLSLSCLIWSDAKILNLYNKSKISEHFCAILRCNQRR